MIKINKFRLGLMLAFALTTHNNTSAATLDSLDVFSPSMNKDIKCNVLLPDNYDTGEQFAVVYLLHGYSGDHNTWVKKYTTDVMADDYSVIVVVPDGGHHSWYWDSPMESGVRYETFVAKELVEYIDANYKTTPTRQARAISGFSMGGHGALYLAIRHQDVFGAAGSMSGGVDIRPFPTRWEMTDHLGTQEEHPENWEMHTVMNQLDLLEPNSLAITFDCGVDDFFFEVNNNLHAELMERKIPHNYMTAPGGHTLKYWQTSLSYHFLFFRDFFNRSK